MDFVLHSMGMPFNGETIKTGSLGGSESAAYYLARGLSARGHRVKVFTSEQKDTVSDGVNYIWHGPPTERAPLGERFTHYAEHTPHDVLIIQRHPLAFHRDYASKINIWQLHDLALYRSKGVIQGGLPRTTIVTTVSEWHKKQVAEVYSINPDVISAVPNGVDPKLYDKARHTTRDCDAAKLVKQISGEGFAMLYQSRPERGLIHLLRPEGIMRRLAKSHPFVHLYLCGYENTTQEMAGFYQQLYAWADELPNVTNLGALNKSDLAEVQCNVDLLCYPTEFEEVSCITAMEAMHAHLPMLSSRVGALPETCEGTGTILLDLKDGQANEDAFVDQIQLLANNLNDPTREGASIMAGLIEQQLHACRTRTWDKATDRLLEAIEKEQRKATPQQLIKHYIEHGDIIAAEQIVPEITDNDSIGRAAVRELASMYAFSQPGNEDALRKHYEHWEAKAITEQGGEDAIAAGLEGGSTTTRFAGIRQYVALAVEKGAKRILEIGCSYGHIILPLAQLFPQVEFVGVDFVGQSIDLARRNAKDRGIENVTFERGSIETLANVTKGKFDAIVAAEIIEHVRDFHGALNTLRDQLELGGALIITTPSGRWEWNGTENFKLGREHLHHFERQDIEEIYYKMPHDVVYAPASHDLAHKRLGSWVYNVIPMDHPFGEIDYARKRLQAVPRQTVSLTMILKDAESTLRKAVSSVVPFVDEIVLGVDPASRDRTGAVVERLREQNPHLSIISINGLRAIDEGFDAARNLVMDNASGDWIMWMDADEEVSGADNIHRLLQTSAMNAYGTAQIHYSTQPAQVLTTDYPARLFRHRRGVRFYGVVHEHPEDKPGSAVSYTAMIGDVQFAHYGYISERVRRARFARNFPLLMRDLEKYPDRILNKFLFLRDIAQSIGFEREQGIVTPDQHARAQRGCELFDELVKLGHLRMITDAMQFYSVCVDVLGGGFDAEVSINSSKPDRPDTAFSVRVKARFRSRDDYIAILNKLAQESISNYDSRYA